ncbi:unnamed protein product, partial [Polarella glacialis]
PLPSCTPNGFLPEYMIWRLAIRIDSSSVEDSSDPDDSCVLVRVAVRKENGKIQSYEWPEDGFLVRILMKAALNTPSSLASHELLLSGVGPVGSVRLSWPKLATVVVVEQADLDKPLVLPAFARRTPPWPPSGALSCRY